MNTNESQYQPKHRADVASDTDPRVPCTVGVNLAKFPPVPVAGPRPTSTAPDAE